jgi:uncharacterized protein YeaO (DUF488 family)
VKRVSDVRVRRVYDEPSADDGVRVLVDRIWPRGLSKERATFDKWCKDVAPSKELRTWYSHDPARFADFSHRFRDELKEAPRAEALEHLRSLAAKGTLTLLTASREVEISQATVLAEVIRDA